MNEDVDSMAANKLARQRKRKKGDESPLDGLRKRDGAVTCGRCCTSRHPRLRRTGHRCQSVPPIGARD